MEEDISLDGGDLLEFVKKMKNKIVPPLTEERMLEATLEHQKEDSYEVFIKDWILYLLDPEIPVYEQWKDFFIRHGYINEKEEIIYKPEDNKWVKKWGKKYVWL